MQIIDYGIIVSKRLLEENSGIITVFTKENGLYGGVVKKLSNGKGSNIYQIGNLVDFTWHARLQTHIGTARCELIKSYSAKIIHDKLKLYLMNSVLDIISISLKSHEKYPNLFDQVNSYLANLSRSPISLLEYIKLELVILSEVGYSLDLSKCAVTGSIENLIYISPKSGKAVCEAVGENYSSQLLTLPCFLLKNLEPESIEDTKIALDLTGYFLKRYIFHNGSQPNYRALLYEYLDLLSRESVGIQ